MKKKSNRLKNIKSYILELSKKSYRVLIRNFRKRFMFGLLILVLATACSIYYSNGIETLFIRLVTFLCLIGLYIYSDQTSK